MSAEDRIADYTKWLMYFTGALALVSAVQIGFLIRAEKTSRIAANAAKQSSDVAASVALPLLSPIAIRVRGFTEVFSLGGALESSVLLEMINYGRTPATINDYEFRCFLGDKLKTSSETKLLWSQTQVDTFVAHKDVATRLFDQNPNLPIASPDIERVLKGQINFWVLTKWHYRDLWMQRYAQGAGFRWDARLGKFVPENSPHWTYLKRDQ